MINKLEPNTIPAKRVRQSNIELLRNISMFMILMLHANFVSLGIPTTEEFNAAFFSTTLRFVFVSLSVVGVNIFVLISGWFGIKPSSNRVFKFIYQIVFFLGIGYIISCLLGFTSFGLKGISHVIQFSSYDWFIKSYFVLMILAPILNLFVTKLDHDIQKTILICFFCFEFIYGWFGGANRFFVYGYGPLHLIGLYILAQYLHYTLPEEKNLFIEKLFSLKPIYDFILYFVFVMLISLQAVMIMKIDKPYFMAHVYAYHSPFVLGGGSFPIPLLHKT